jgi:predicted glycosyltransferase
MGHLVRSLALASSLREHYRVVFLNGGPLPQGVEIPDGVELVNLPPLGLDANGRLISRDRRRSLERAQSLRQQTILDTYRRVRPLVLFIELFPFGRKKFASELLPLLHAARQPASRRRLICCSLRDILVSKGSQQEQRDERAVELANKYFDVVLVHSDPDFARLEDSLVSYSSLRVPVHYTGFVQPQRHNGSFSRQKQILVSAGGGLVGEQLFRVAIQAWKLLARRDGLKLMVVTGPFLPQPAHESLRRLVQRSEGVSLRKFLPDVSAEMHASIASVSQGGYNTVLDILNARVPALVVPFGGGQEDEQLKRARRLERCGAIRVLEQTELTPELLALELQRLLDFTPRPVALQVNGAANTTRIIQALLAPGKQQPKSQRVREQPEVQL